MITITPELALQWQRAGQPDWGWWVTLGDEQREIFAAAGDELFAVRFGALSAANTPTPEHFKAIAESMATPSKPEMIAPPEFNRELSESEEARLDSLLADAANSLQQRVEAGRHGRN